MGFASRIWAFLRFMGFATFFALRRGGRYDCVIATSTPLTVGVPALAARCVHGTPFVFDVGDVWPDAAIAAGVLRNRLIIWLARRLEMACYRCASRVVAFSSGMRDRIVSKGVPSAKVSVIPNCCDVQEFAPDATVRADQRRLLGAGDATLVVLYVGAMGRSNAIEDVVEAVRQTANDERIAWWFAGDGADAPKLVVLAEDPQFAQRVHFLGRVAKRDIPALCQGADVALVTFMHAPLFVENSPNKFFDAIAAGLPVLFNRSTWLEPWLKEYDCGIVCGRADAGREMAEHLKVLAADRPRRQHLGQGARRLAEEVFSRDKLAAEFLAIVEGAGRGRTAR
jgi:glycosyltransferase involved in cell wall biosynthesis